MYKGYIGNFLSQKFEVCCGFFFFCAKYVFPTAINRQLMEMYSDKVMTECSISENRVEFRNIRKKIHDDNCTGRPDTSKTAGTSAKVEI